MADRAVDRLPSTDSRSSHSPESAPSYSDDELSTAVAVEAEEGVEAVPTRDPEKVAEEARKPVDPWQVRFDPGEKANPKNWSLLHRWVLTGIGGMYVLNATFASSGPSGIIEDMMAYFGFNHLVGVLTISLFVAGYCVGPLLWGPLSERYGRRPVFMYPFIVYTAFQVGSALSKNTASILIFRFLGGCFASAPLTNSGGMIADIWDVDHRGQAMSLFSVAPIAGPALGPIISGFMSVSGISWRWFYWITTIFAGFCCLLVIFFTPETFEPVLLVAKAKRLRKETGEERWFAPFERAHFSLKKRIKDICFKPFVMLALEPMLLSVTIYMSFVYGIMYLLFEAFPFVFVEKHHFNLGENGLAFLGLVIGGTLVVVYHLTVNEPRYLKAAAAAYPEKPTPEKRLELTIVSSWAMTISMFWFGWTSYASVPWIVPMLAIVLVGIAIVGMFISLLNYIVDVYLFAAASALAATTVARSIFGAGFPLFATSMYERLGTQWASSLLGFLALAMTPMPLVLIKYGPVLRKKSRFSPTM